MPARYARSFSTVALSGDLLTNALLVGFLILLPNLLVAVNLAHVKGYGSGYRKFYLDLDRTSILLWLLTNIIFSALFFLMRRYIITPVQGMMKQVQDMLAPGSPHNTSSVTLISLRLIASDITRMTQLAQTYYRQHQEANSALEDVKYSLSQLLAQQHTILSHTSREIVSQYQSVLAYANYLEEHISRRSLDPSLRYDFDDVSESSFNLRLIAGALSLIQKPLNEAASAFDVPLMIEQTMLALSASLDRRSMKLTTIEVDLGVKAYSQPTLIIHVLWMLLLGTIRYAADESTLRLRCLYSRDRRVTLLSIVVSELSPGRLTEDERSAFMARQLQHLTPHMFAETIRIHANMQLAELLLNPLDARVSVLPLTNYSCEICLSLPSA